MSYAEWHYAECHYAECHYTECHYAECRGGTKGLLMDEAVRDFNENLTFLLK